MCALRAARARAHSCRCTRSPPPARSRTCPLLMRTTIVSNGCPASTSAAPENEPAIKDLPRAHAALLGFCFSVMMIPYV